ncbi:unnamed protein product [Blepharisma stoltei]|uniref:SKP1-like protein n=1 Tax=Blepharisma stoltei TaxID=1481888 RepID=A0AAU9ISX0_9CILI|nr:unnamed protein product [Blepharisma stoltei]
MADTKLKLKSREDQIFEVEVGIALQSQLIKSVVEDSGTEEEIPLPNVRGPILEKVIEYLRHYKDSQPLDIERPLKADAFEESVPAWDSEFIKLRPDVVLELLSASNYLDIKPLIDLCAAKIASMLDGKSPEEIRNYFGLENDLTPEEQEKFQQEVKCLEIEDPVV